MSWKLTAYASKPVVQAALLEHDEREEWDFDLVISGREIAEDKPQDWVLEAWYPSEPGAQQKRAIASLFAGPNGGKTPKITSEKLPDEDWLTLSQLGVDPIRAGRFCVHTPEHAPNASEGVVNLAIPASQAFGTGQHETTASCLAMLDAMKKTGVVARNIADIGTGTGLLAFAARALWPKALLTASDIDEVCAGVVTHNAGLNQVSEGAGPGAVTMVIAAGTDDPLIEARGPYDVLIANILAGPLVDLAPDFAAATTQGGHVLLAGLLQRQEDEVRRAYRAQGFRLAARQTNGDWSILWLRKRR
ncbi:MAG: 50S ribosomal protein L11 methyltransferase [Erythrobacter sp.]